MNIDYVGNGKVMLIAGGGKIYTDIAAKFCTSSKSLQDIMSSEYDSKLVKRVIQRGHEAVVEFDYFLFGIEGYSRVTETQLVRKRIGVSYAISSGRVEKKGKREFDMIIPKSIISHTIDYKGLNIDYKDILNIVEMWYNKGIEHKIPEEELRFLKPQATKFKAIIGMNAHALRDWFRIRCCMKAQTEIRDLAIKMQALCKKVAPDLFKNSGPNCVRLGYCPENSAQHPGCIGKYPTKTLALKILKNHYKHA